MSFWYSTSVRFISDAKVFLNSVMNIKDILSDNTRTKAMLFNADIYSGIYKKTEKITCAVFLITDYQKDQGSNDDLIKDVRDIAKDALVQTSMLVSHTDTAESVHEVIGSLMSLRSLLYVLAAARVVRADLVDVLAREIDGVIVLLGRLSHEGSAGLSEAIEYQPQYLETSQRKVRTIERPRERVGAVHAPLRTQPSVDGGTLRRDAILEIIRARGKVSIKDISDSITDVSEKTIQRELMDMIKDNIIVREGERRWSRYSVLNT